MIWSMSPSCIVQVGLPCCFFKGASVPPDKCEVIDQFILFAVDRSASSLCSQVNSGGLSGWVPPMTSPPSISDSSRPPNYTHTHTNIKSAHIMHTMNDSLPVVPTPLIPATILISLEGLQGQGSTVCVSGVSWCCQIKVLSSVGVLCFFLFVCVHVCPWHRGCKLWLLQRWSWPLLKQGSLPFVCVFAQVCSCKDLESHPEQGHLGRVQPTIIIG